MTLEIFKITSGNEDDVAGVSVVDEAEQSKLFSNCLPVCNPSICVPDTGECPPTHKP